VSEELVALRRAFDEPFASPPGTEGEAVEDFLAVKVADDPCAFRVRAITHLSGQRKIVPLPGRRAELLGLAGIRGAIVPVYSLARLLGHPAAGEPARWLVTCGVGLEAAFAFEELQRYLRVPAASVSPVGPSDAPRPHVEALVREGSLVRAVIDLASIVRALTTSSPGDGSP
jgi:purine-binding chemotaxis protein CheW